MCAACASLRAVCAELRCVRERRRLRDAPDIPGLARVAPPRVQASVKQKRARCLLGGPTRDQRCARLLCWQSLYSVSVRLRACAVSVRCQSVKRSRKLKRLKCVSFGSALHSESE